MQQLDNYLDSKRAKFRGFMGGVKKEFTILTRYPVSLVTGMGQMIFIMAVFLLAVPLFAGSGDSTNAMIVSQVMIWGFAIFMLSNMSMWEIGTSLRREQTQGTIESLYMTPASQFLNLCSRISINSIVVVLFTMTGVIFAGLLIGGIQLNNVLPGLVLYILAAMTAYGFGFILAGLSIRWKEAIQTWINLFQFAMMIFCAFFFPFNTLGPLKLVSYLIPLSYYVDLFRSTLMSFPAGYPELVPVELLWIEWLICIFFAIVTPLIGFWMYKKQIDSGKKKGNLATY